MTFSFAADAVGLDRRSPAIVAASGGMMIERSSTILVVADAWSFCAISGEHSNRATRPMALVRTTWLRMCGPL